MKVKEFSYLNKKAFRSRSLRERHKVPNVINLIHAYGIRRNIVATTCARRLWLLSYWWTGRPTVLIPVSKNFSRLHVFHTKMNVFIISPQTCPFSLNTFRWLKSGVQLISRIENYFSLQLAVTHAQCCHSVIMEKY